MDRRTLIGSTFLIGGLAACSPVNPQRNIAPPPDLSGGGQSLERLVGLKLRVVRPGQMVTMDYNPRRLTVQVGEDNRITSARIG